MVSLRYVNVRHYDPPHPPVGFFLGWANPVMKRRNHTPLCVPGPSPLQIKHWCTTTTTDFVTLSCFGYNHLKHIIQPLLVLL